MTRPLFRTSGADVTAKVDPVTGVLSLPASSTNPAPLPAWDAYTGGSQVTDLSLNESGTSPITAVPASTISDPQGAFYGPDGYEGSLYLQDANGRRWRVDPDNVADLAAEGGTGTGLPSGGTAGQALVKQTSDDGDAAWETLTLGGVDNAVPTTIVDQAGDLIVGTDDNAVARLERGEEGDFLRATADGIAYMGADIASIDGLGSALDSKAAAASRYWDPSARTWTPRPSVAANAPVVAWSTNDATAVQPPAAVEGDVWARHPDAPSV